MKKEIFENPNDLAKIGQGANLMKRDVGGKASGQLVAKGLDDISQGKQVSSSIIQALEPYANILSDIFSNNKYRTRFLQMVRQMHQELMKNKNEPEMASVENNDEPVNENYIAGPEMMPGAVEQEEDEETVTYSKTKKQGDSTVTISANADSMKELHDILKLAGITLPKEKNDAEPEHDMETPCPDCGEVDCGCDDGCDYDEEPKNAPSVLVTPKLDNPSYSTDKETLVGMLKDKLKKSLS